MLGAELQLVVQQGGIILEVKFSVFVSLFCFMVFGFV